MKKTILILSIVMLVFAFTIEANSSRQSRETWIDDEYVEMCEEIGYAYGVSPELLEAIIEKESSGQADAYNSYGCYGLMQIHKESHLPRMRRLGVTNLYDPYSNILVGTDYLLELFEEYEDPYEVLKIYGGWNGTDGEKYINQVLERAHELEIVHEKMGANG